MWCVTNYPCLIFHGRLNKIHVMAHLSNYTPQAAGNHRLNAINIWCLTPVQHELRWVSTVCAWTFLAWQWIIIYICVCCIIIYSTVSRKHLFPWVYFSSEETSVMNLCISFKIRVTNATSTQLNSILPIHLATRDTKISFRAVNLEIYPRNWTSEGKLSRL